MCRPSRAKLHCEDTAVLLLKLRNGTKKSKKIYFYDLGIRNASLDNFTPFSSRSDLERGALWENFVIIERLKWHRYRQDETQLYFWRDRNKSEVDLWKSTKTVRFTPLNAN